MHRSQSAFVWRAVLYGLVAAQLIAILAFLLAVFRPELDQQASFIYTMFGLTSFIGLLLWSVESVIPRPALTRFALRAVLLSCTFWAMSPLFLLLKPNKRLIQERADVTGIFQQMIAEGEVARPPSPPTDFTVGRKGPCFVISYKTQDHEQRYYVRDKCERFWVFRNLSDRSEITRPQRHQ
ncbi:MAG: hypothetical protein WCH98_23725 [Verrucomicrobiota bacterium]